MEMRFLTNSFEFCSLRYIQDGLSISSCRIANLFCEFFNFFRHFRHFDDLGLLSLFNMVILKRFHRHFLRSYEIIGIISCILLGFKLFERGVPTQLSKYSLYLFFYYSTRPRSSNWFSNKIQAVVIFLQFVLICIRHHIGVSTF